MNTLNALGFLLCGIGMIVGPWLVPNLFTTDALSGGFSGLWVEFMGWVNGLTGIACLVVSRLTAPVRRTLAWPPADASESAGMVLRPALVRPQASLPPERREVA
jgi:hypothetical protein